MKTKERNDSGTQDEPLVSVCIPAFNAEQFVAEAIQSVLDQTYQRVEIIVVDDGSTDGTAAVLDGFRGAIQRFTTVNQGAPKARNHAIAHARGEFMQFLDADNYLRADAIEKKLKALKQRDADLAFSNMVVLHDSGELQHVHSRMSPDGIDPFIYCLDYNVPGGTTAIDTNVGLHRADLVRRVGGFRAGVAPCDDKDLAFRLTAAGARLAYVDEELTVYRDHAGPRISTAQRDPEYPLDYFVGLVEVLAGGEQYHIEGNRRLALAQAINILAKEKYRTGVTDVALAGFECASRLVGPGTQGRMESGPYRLVRSLLGYPRTEWLRARLRAIVSTDSART